jgi:hypothetical protein
VQHPVLYQRVCACGGEALLVGVAVAVACSSSSRARACVSYSYDTYDDGSATTTAHSGHPPRPRRPPPPRSPPPRQPRPQRGGGFASSVCVDQSSAQGGERVLCPLQVGEAVLSFSSKTARWGGVGGLGIGFARPLQGELGTYLITALPPRAAVDTVRCTVVKATLLRSQPCAMLPRARQVALAQSNLIFTRRRRSHKASCLGQVPLLGHSGRCWGKWPRLVFPWQLAPQGQA